VLNSITRCIAAAVVAAGVAVSASGQQDSMTNEQLIEDLIHYQKIDQREAFAATADELLGRGLTGAQLVELVTAQARREARFNEAVVGAMQEAGLEDKAAALYELFEKGKLERAREAGEISRNIALLQGNLRARRLAHERLKAAGEYAMPQLLETFLQTDSTDLRAELQRVMIGMGLQAVQPLAAALPYLGAARQEQVVNILGLIDYQEALPYLSDLRDATDSPEVRAACDEAIGRLGGTNGLSTGELYYELAQDYYEEKRGMTSFPGEEYQLLWSYDPGIGLEMTPIVTQLFHEAKAMQSSERALVLSRENPEALALWIAANFSRELDTPEGYENPAYGADRPEAMYFAVAAGVDVGQRVLGRAIDDRDTRLARKAIAAIERVAGGSGLWHGPGVRRPLLEALNYPNRRVQFESALALGGAQPTAPFDGSDRVVPTLAAAIRDPGSRSAVVLTGDAEQYASMRTLLTGMGYSVLPRARTIDELSGAIAEAPAIDLMVTSLTTDATIEMIRQAQASARLSATPIVALVSSQDYARLRRRYDEREGVALRSLGITDAQFRETADALLAVTTGEPINAAEAVNYAERALRVLRDLAVSRSPVFSVSDATMPLIAAMNQYDDRMKMSVADVLARIGEQRAQVALMDEALNASGDERIVLLGYVADSAKRFGNLLADRQVRRLIELARTGERREATAAAAAMGALNLPNESLLPLIIGE